MTSRGNNSQVLQTGRIAYGSDGSDEYPLLIDSSGRLILGASTIMIGSVNPPFVEMAYHPFAKGTLVSSGTAQYSTEVTTASTAFTSVEAITITQPSNYTLVEVQFSLVGKVKSSGATKAVLYKWQASDAGTLWTDLNAAVTRAADASTYADTTPQEGAFAPTGNFLATGTSFQVRFVIQAETQATETASGCAKNTSWIICKYRRT